MWELTSQRRGEILLACWQHLALVVPCLALATVLAVGLAALVHRHPAARAASDTLAAMALSIPSFALLAVLMVLLGAGVVPAVVVLTLSAALPVLRHALVGFCDVPGTVSDSAHGLGMGRIRVLATVELPLAWPVILAGVRVSARLSMGVAALAAYAVGAGLGGLIFSGLARQGGGDALGLVLEGVLAVVVLAAVLDLALVLLGRLTTPRGIRA